MTDGMTWRKARRCESHTCVEVAGAFGHALVRDGKDPDGEVLTFPAPAWTAFLGMVRRG